MRGDKAPYRHLLATCLLGVASVTGSARGASAAEGPIIAYPNPADAPALARVAPPAALLARASEQGGQLRVIVGLRTRPGEEGGLGTRQRDVLADLGARRLPDGSYAGQGVQGVTLFTTVPFLAVTADDPTLRRVLADPRVVSVQEDQAFPPALSESVPLIRADRAAARGFTAAGQVVAVLDTGVVKSHPMLAGKVVSEACYSTTVAGRSTSVCPDGARGSTAVGSGRNCPLGVSHCDHGTPVASVAVGSASGPDGVARGARLIAVQVFSRFDSPSACGDQPAPCALSYMSDQIRGLERVYALRSAYPIAAVNVSIASRVAPGDGGLFASDCDASFPGHKAAIDRLRAAGIATVIAAGNDGRDGSVRAPACISSAVTVGSTTKADRISPFSNHAPLVELLAPGSVIRAAAARGGRRALSGTSLAAPHVAGAWAILKQAKPSAGVSKILAALACTGRTVSRAGVAKPRIDVLGALNVLRSPAAGCG